MKKIFLFFVLFSISLLVFSQKSLSPICKYSYKETEVRPSDRGDTSMIFYKGQFVGLAYCEKNKLKGGVIHYINHIFDVNSAKVATVAAEGNQLLIKYTNPYKIVYIKGLQYNKVLYQMVEVDKKLTPKE